MRRTTAREIRPFGRSFSMSTYSCPECGYLYDENEGDAYEGYPPGTPFVSLPADFACPDCAITSKGEFRLAD